MQVGDLVLIAVFFCGLWCAVRNIIEGLDRDAPRLVPHAPTPPIDARRTNDFFDS